MSDRSPVPEERIFGATVRAYRYGGARVLPWNNRRYFHLFGGEAA